MGIWYDIMIDVIWLQTDAIPDPDLKEVGEIDASNYIYLLDPLISRLMVLNREEEVFKS